ncbi:MAG: hypothetical protein HFE04_02320, partial [Bacilli bacterium]|nr:hypothetical protein [Bacilli bacterium]
DAVSQISSGENLLISVAVMKSNNTHELLKNNQTFAISVLGKKVDPKIIETFGLNSMRYINKFEKIETIEIENQKIIKDSLGYMICEIIDTVENDTHTLFIGRLKEADVIKEDEPMTYAYYQENKDELIKVTTTKGQTAWICTICGYIYYGEEIPEDYTCPICGAEKIDFKIKN